VRLKSYYSASIAAAIEQARAELGPDAIILQSRKAPEEARHMGEYEVVVGQAPEEEPQAAPARNAPADRLSLELAELRRELETMHRTISRSVLTTPRWATPGQGLAQVFARLIAADLESDLAREIVDAIEGAADPETALRRELGRRLQVNDGLGWEGSRPRVAVLVGPPGCGKTATAAKLAARFGLRTRRPVQLISMDNYRVGGADQLRSYAAILGMGFQALETPGALAQAIEEHRHKELILVDTAGYGTRELENARDFAAFLARRTDVDTHLVLTASMKAADLNRVAERYEIFRPAKLLFTRLDETETLGTLYTLAARSGRPLSYLGTGQQIPEDLDAANRERLIGTLLAGGRRSSVAA